MPGPGARGAFGSAIVYGGLVVAIFTSFALISRLGTQSSLTADDLTALRFGIGGLLLLPVIVRHGLGGLKFIDAAALALFGGIGFAMLAYAGLSRTPANHGSVLLHGSLPLAAILLASLLSGRRPTRKQSTGSMLIAIGIVVMAWDSLQEADLHQMSGDLLLVIAALSWSA